MRFLIVFMLLAGCGGGPLSFLTGGGPNVAANVQAGAENEQGVNTDVSTSFDQRVQRTQARDIRQESTTTRVKADEVTTVVVNEVPWWVILLAVLGWLLPSPGEIGRSIRNAFRRRET